MAVTPTNRPFWVIRSRNAGPRPGGTAEDSRTATAIRTGMAASAHSMAQVRRRRNSTPSSDASRPRPWTAPPDGLGSGGAAWVRPAASTEHRR